MTTKKKSAKRKKGGQQGNTNAVKWTQALADKLGNDLLKWMKKPGNVFYKKFLLQKDIYQSVISFLSEKYDSFSNIIKVCKEIQEQKLIDGAMNHKHNSGMSIFMLKNKHGYADKTEIDDRRPDSITVTRTVVSRQKDKDQDSGSLLKKVS